jgi:NAD(P)-dependent dehydrogenase (short-subunit alcohol dehydrogenase family)
MTETVVITGASAGIGRATAELFGQRGANVVLLARGFDGLQAAARAVEDAGGKALTVPTDVADFQAVDEAAALAEAQFGPIDIWVNVAFTSVFAPFWEIKADEFRRVTEVSYLGFVHGTMAALSRMRPRNQGTIVQVGSALGYRAIPLQSAYCGAKHAVNGFTESVRTELMHDHSKVRITIVQMPAVNTPQFNWVLSRLPRRPQPVPPIYEPEVAAEGVVFAADHPDRKEHWVGASTVGTIVAQKFAAPLLDQYLARTGYDSQQTGEKAEPNRPSNLWQPVDQPPGSDQGAHGRFDDRSKPRSAQLTVAERVEEAGATVRRAFDSLISTGRDNLLGGGRSRQTRPEPKSSQDTWSEATSQQTDQEALVAGHDTTPPAQSGNPPAQSTTPSKQETESPAETAPPPAEGTLSESPSQSEIRLSESGADLQLAPNPAAVDPLEGAPPLTGMDVPPAHTAPPVSTEDTPWYRGPETPPHGESPASPGVGTLSPEEGTQVADQEVMAPTETDDPAPTGHPDQPQS